MLGKYSPTVSSAYDANQQWFTTYSKPVPSAYGRQKVELQTKTLIAQLEGLGYTVTKTKV